MNNIALGIDIGGTNTKVGFVDGKGEVLHSFKIPTNSKIDFEQYSENLWEEIQSEFAQLGSGHKLIAAGVGAPNANSTNGKIENPPNLDWEVAELVSIFSRIFNLPVKLENDANIAAVGEKKFGKAINFENFIVITLGTGIGTGTYINNELYTGSHSLGSEGGHLTIIPNGRPCNCGGYGHLEAYGSVLGIKKTCHEMLGEDLKFAEISERFHQGDKKIEQAVGQTAHYLAAGLSSMGTILSPQAFIFSGGVSTLGEKFRDMIFSEYSKVVYTPFKNNSQILISDISSKYGAILGAASLVL